MPSYKGFTATVYDSQTSLPLPEYNSSFNTNTNITTSYIETNQDQPFTIVLRDATSACSQGTAVYVDGVYVDNGLTGPGIATERRWYGKRVDHELVRPFVFRRNPSGTFHAPSPRCSGDPVSGLMVESNAIWDAGEIGTITLVLRKCHVGGMAEDQTNRGTVPQDMDTPGVRNLHTREDYLAHRAEYRISYVFRSDDSYASPTSIPATLYHVQWIDTHPGPPFCQFRFIYRSREVLMSRGIIPPPMKKEIEEQTQTKKRKLTSKKKTTKKNELQPSSSATTLEIPSSVPSKPRASKKAKTSTTPKIQSKKDFVSPTTEEESPISLISTDLPTSPLVAVLERRGRSSSHTFASSPPESSTPVDSHNQSDILRELRELRVYSLSF